MLWIVISFVVFLAPQPQEAQSRRFFMSELKKIVDERTNDDSFITIEEFSSLERLFKKKIQDYKIKKSVRGKSTPLYELGLVLNGPYNPISGFDYPNEEKYKPLWNYYNSHNSCGQFATERQWEDIGRKCTGKSVMKKASYGNNVSFYPYEQTKEI